MTFLLSFLALVSPRRDTVAPQVASTARVSVERPAFACDVAADTSHLGRALDHVNHEIYLRQLSRDSDVADERLYRALADLAGDSANHRVRRDLATYAARCA